MNKKHKAFTLIEVLVVVAIIALLAGILMPSLANARMQARRSVCTTNLHQVGLAMMAYLQDNKDRMPYISWVPSTDPFPRTTEEGTVYFADVMKKHLKNPKVLQCPEDTPGKTNREGQTSEGVPKQGKSFFQTERSSYEYRQQLHGLTPIEFNNMTHGPPGHEHKHDDDSHPANTIWFARDYENFHSRDGKVGQAVRRYAYIDGHVSDFEN